MSSFEGVKSPEGWLCATIIELELLINAFLNITLWSIKQLFKPPKKNQFAFYNFSLTV